MTQYDACSFRSRVDRPHRQLSGTGGSRSFLLPVAAALSLSLASCTDIMLAHYRDDAFLSGHQYTLGEQYVTVDGMRLCYQDFGNGRPVVILPGLGTSIDFWQLNVPAIAEEYRVLALDPPGFGKSDKPDASYELPWLCDKIVAFLDAKGIRRAAFIGGSMGGHLALLVALNHPDRVDKLVLMGSSGTWERPGVLLDLVLKGCFNEAIVIDHLRRTWPDVFPSLFKSWTPVTQSLFRYQMAVRADGPRFAPEGRAAARALRSIFYTSCRGRLVEVGQPVLLIWGAEDHIHPLREAEYFRDHLPESELVVVQDAAHEVMLDQPEVFNRTVLAFLGSGPDTVPGCDVPSDSGASDTPAARECKPR